MRFSEKKFKINIIYDKTTNKYKVSLFWAYPKRQQTFFAIIVFMPFWPTTPPSVTNFLCKDPPYLLKKSKKIRLGNREKSTLSEDLEVPLSW